MEGMHKKILTTCYIAIFLGMLGMFAYFITQDTPTAGVELLGKVGGGNSGNNGGGNGGNNGGGGGNNGNNGGGNGGAGGDNGNNGGGNGGGTGGGDGGNSGNGNNGGGGDNGNNGGGNGGGGGGGQTSIRSRGLAQHAAAMHVLLKRYGLHTNANYSYTYHHESVHPAAFASGEEKAAWMEKVHEVTCRMYTYLKRQRENHANIKNGYIDWIAGQLADATGEDRVELRAALLGYPHEHGDHMSALLQTFGEAGCAGGGSQRAIEHGNTAEEHMLHGSVEESASRFTVLDASTDTEIAFQILEHGAAFADYGVSHTKEMHLLIVRDDLRHFAHVHPERDENGMWHIAWSAPYGGTYWMLADFADADLAHYTVRFDRNYGGDLGATGVSKDMRNRKETEKYSVVLETSPYSQGTLFTFHIDDADGKTPNLEPYLGALGHSILFSPKGDFIHTHPSPAGDHLIFHVADPQDDYYRIFTQFQIDGMLHQVEFDWMPKQKNRSVIEHRH